MNFVLATAADVPEILKLYRSVIGSEGCTWSLDYPNKENIQNDLARNALFCMKTEEGEIIGAISIDDDPLVGKLDCWTAKLSPGGELARLVVKETCQNQSIARKLLQEGMRELKERGYKSVHFLVSKTNYRALRSYDRFQFEKKGESDLFGEHWWCYEKEL